jgi:hypothetical protein
MFDETEQPNTSQKNSDFELLVTSLKNILVDNPQTAFFPNPKKSSSEKVFAIIITNFTDKAFNFTLRKLTNGHYNLVLEDRKNSDEPDIVETFETKEQVVPFFKDRIKQTFFLPPKPTVQKPKP